MSRNFHSQIRRGPGHARPLAADRLTAIVICGVILLIIMYFAAHYLVSAV